MGAQPVTVSIADYEDEMPYFEYIYEQYLCEGDSNDISFGAYFYKHQDMETRRVYKAQCLGRGTKLNEVDEDVIEEFCRQHQNLVEVREADRRLEFHRASKLSDETVKKYHQRITRLLSMMEETEARILVKQKIFMSLPDKVARCLRDDEIDVQQMLRKWETYLRDRSPVPRRNHPGFEERRGNMVYERSKPAVTSTRGPSNAEEQRVARSKTDRLSKSEWIASLTCYTCNEKGHTSRGCPKRFEKPEGTKVGLGSLYYPPELDHVMIETAVRLDGKDVVCLIDTGAAKTTLPVEHVKYFKHVSRPFSIMAQDIAGRDVEITHRAEVNAMSILTQVNSSIEVYFARINDPVICANDCMKLEIDITTLMKEKMSKSSRIIKKLGEAKDFDERVYTELCLNSKLYSSTYLEPKVVVDVPMDDKLVPKHFQHYKMDNEEKLALSKEINNELVAKRLYQTVTAKMTSPISMVKKSDDEYRPCVDARYINQHMIEVKCRLPSKYEVQCLWSMSENETVGKADLCNAFKSFKVMEDKQWISGINTHLGDYISPRLQFGYKSSSAIYTNKLRQLLDEFELDKTLVINYVDDLAFVGKKENQVMSWVKFIRLCSKYNLPINLEKCQFQMKSMDFLGQTFSRFGMSIENKKLVELQSLKVPRSVSELQTSIGKLQYCRAYIKDIAMLIKRIASKRNALPERELLEETWKEIQSNLKETRTLYIPEKNDILIFEVADFGLHPETVDTEVYVMKDVKKIVQVIERTLSNSEKNYNKCELELLALENAIKHYHGYGHELSIITKSTAIEWILRDDVLNRSDMSRRVMKFAVPIILSGVKVKVVNDETKVKLSKIRYLETNNLPSYMSAYEHGELLEDQKDNPLINMIVESWIDQTGTCMKKLPALLRNGTDLIEMQEGIIVFDNKPIVSKEYLKRKAYEWHIKTHTCAVMMKEEMSEKYVCIGSGPVYNQIYAECKICQSNSRNKPSKAKSYRWFQAEYPRHRGHLDIMMYEGMRILVLVDAFSNYVWAWKLKVKSTKSVIECLNGIFMQHPFQYIVVDNEPTLNSTELVNWLNEKRISNIVTTKLNSPIYHSESNGLVERHIGILRRKMDKFKSISSNINECLVMSVAAINASKKRAQRFYALGFRKPRPHEETRYQLLSKERNIWFKPRGKLARKFEEGKLVGYLGKRIAHIRVDDGKEYFISTDYVKENASVEEEPIDDDEMWEIVELFGDPPISTSIDLTLNEEDKVGEKMDEILFINEPVNGKELNDKMDEILSINGSLNGKELDDEIDQLSSSTESFNGKELDKLLMKDIQDTELLVNKSKSCNDRKRNESLAINDQFFDESMSNMNLVERKVVNDDDVDALCKDYEVIYAVDGSANNSKKSEHHGIGIIRWLIKEDAVQLYRASNMFKEATSDKMELVAMIAAHLLVEEFKDKNCVILSDNIYVVEGASEISKLKSYARNPKQVHQKLWEKLDFIRIGMRTSKPDVLHYSGKMSVLNKGADALAKDLVVSKVAAILKPLNITDMTIAELGKTLCSKLLD